MRWPLRYQLLVPFAILLVVTVATTAVTSSYLAVVRATDERVQQAGRILDTLSGMRLPYTRPVLEQMQSLSGAQFIVVSQSEGLIASTLDIEQVDPNWIDWDRTSIPADSPRQVEWQGERFRMSGRQVPGRDRSEWILVLFPEATWQQYQWQAAWPPLAIGAATLLVMLLVSLWLALSQARRIERIQRGLNQLAQGTFNQLELTGPNDELRDLIESTNQLAQQLADMQTEIRRTEQYRLLGQLASGLAHQLRNAVAGARLAIQLHLKRQTQPVSESLTIALRQLELTNRQIQSLLALSRQSQQTCVPVDLVDLLDELRVLIQPHVEHLKIDWQAQTEIPPGCWVDRDSMLAALMNLLMNAIEAAGQAGVVRLVARFNDNRYQIQILDNGPGVSDDLQDTMFEPFVTGKSEGVGIGLTMALQTVSDHQGQLEYRRHDGQTEFCLNLPPRPRSCFQEEAHP